MTVIFLKDGKERKIKNLYPWIFPDEVKEIVGDEPSFGEIVNVFSSKGEFLGKAFYGRRIRMIAREDVEIDGKFFKAKIEKALERRKDLGRFYRLFHAEADGIPGLVIDRYGDGFVIQLRNKGVERFRNEIVDSLLDLFKPNFIHERSDFETDLGENVEGRNETLYGKVPEDLRVEENGLLFKVDVVRGQKTGFFFDQRRNRLLVRNLQGKKALDLYTYTGGFALNLALAGFEVIGVDISGYDLEVARENARMNGLNVEFVESDVFDFLRENRNKFDVVVADPPSLIKSKSEKKKAVRIFSELVSLIDDVLRDRGKLVLCSCAHQMDLQSLIESMRKGVEGRKVAWRILNVTYQDIDHPWIAQIPETLYLKCVWAVKDKP